MKYSTRVSDAVHIMAFIVLNPKGSLSSNSIAESLHTNPGCVRQLMSRPSPGGTNLKRTGTPHTVSDGRAFRYYTAGYL